MTNVRTPACAQACPAVRAAQSELAAAQNQPRSLGALQLPALDTNTWLIIGAVAVGMVFLFVALGKKHGKDRRRKLMLARLEYDAKRATIRARS